MIIIKAIGPFLFFIGLFFTILPLTPVSGDPQAQAVAIIGGINFIFYGVCLCVLAKMMKDER